MQVVWLLLILSFVYSHRTDSKKTRQNKGFTPFTVSLDFQKVRSRNTNQPIAQRAEDLTVVICALLKDEDLYIDEWIKFNKHLGFDRIHLYDNSEIGSVHIGYLPQKYGDFVDVYHYPAPSPQLRAYTHCGLRYNQSNVWVAFIDIDEFIVLRKHASIKDLLHELTPFGGALSLNRVFFGSNNLTHYDDRPVVERFTHRQRGIDSLVKTIAFIPDVTQYEIHYALLRKGMKRIDCHGTEQGHRKSFQSNGTSHGIPSNGTEDIALIHHYYTKSYDEFRHKRLRGDSSKFARGMLYRNATGEKLIAEQYAQYNSYMNEVYDPTALWFYQNKSVELSDFPRKHVFDSIV